MNVSLTAELEQYINQQVERGMYASASEVVREGIRLLKARDDERRLKLEALRRDIELGLEHTDEGRIVPGRKASMRVRAKAKRRRRKTG